ncbi:MAG: hypothetical protein HRT35_03570 [Algicola sp.]|nr:hypothetical protein [Algicola sp.]
MNQSSKLQRHLSKLFSKLSATIVIAGLTLPLAACASDTVDNTVDNTVDSTNMQVNKTKIHFKNGHSDHRITIMDDHYSFSLKGKVVFADDDKSIESMPSKSRLKIHLDKDTDKSRELDIRADKNGDITVLYWLAGEQTLLSDNGKKLLGEVLPQILRESGIHGKARVARKLAKGGFDGVMKYIETVQSESTMGSYLGLLLEQHSVDKAQWLVVADKLQRIESEHALASVIGPLFIGGHKLGFDDNMLLDLVDKLESEHYKAQIFSDYLRTVSSDYQSLERVFTQLDSEHYRAMLLEQVLNDKRNASLDIVGVHDLLRLVQSDHYKAQLYAQVLKKRGGEPDVLKDIVMSLDSDHYRIQMVQQWLGDHHQQSHVLEVFFAAVDFIESDHFKLQAYDQLLSKREKDQETMMALLDGLDKIRSEHFRTQIINRIISQDEHSEAVISAIRASILDLNSRSQQQMLNRRMTKLEKS